MFLLIKLIKNIIYKHKYTKLCTTYIYIYIVGAPFAPQPKKLMDNGPMSPKQRIR